MNENRTIQSVVLLAAGTVCAACVAPRSIGHSGRVTPRGELRAGLSVDLNIGTASGSALFDGLSNTADELVKSESREFNDNFQTLAKAAIAYSVDPFFAVGMGIGLRYGIVERFDAGYRYQAGANVLDARYQFMGEPGNRAKDGDFSNPSDGMSGSVGLQFSSQSFELPSFAGIDKVGDYLGFHMERKELLVPVAFSYPFGADEEYGSIAFGVVGGYARLKYGLDPNALVKDIDGVKEAIAAVTDEQTFATYGVFVNAKLGYRYAYVGLGMAIYYQDYGTFKLLDGGVYEMSGATVVPNINFELRY